LEKQRGKIQGELMPIKIALGGDVNFSRHRGEIAYLVLWKNASLTGRCWRKLIKVLWAWGNYYPSRQINYTLADHKLGNYRPTLEIKNILLEEYSGNICKHSIREMNEYNDYDIPFKKIGKFFRDADIGVINLETPLSERGRHIGAFCSSPEYARILKENKIGIVSVANNHSFDAGETGFIETINVLKQNNIAFFGGGMNIEEARKGEIIDIKGVKVGFLGYTSLCNSFFMSLAKKDQPGILPLFEPIVLDDIRSLKKKCDFLIVAPHFDIENISKIHKNSIDIAHKMVDCGADLVIGGHAHIPKPIEKYKGKLIIYCLGSLIFMEKFNSWGNSLVAEIILSDAGEYEKARFYPISSNDINCSSPHIMKNKEGHRLLSRIKRDSKKIFKTPLALNEHILEIS
jgi:poly-gamma-glutamate synthesis protein (capsule biosynthesis protein)